MNTFHQYGEQLELLENIESLSPFSILAASDPEVTVLSYGCGQDSTAIAAKIVFDPTFRHKYAPKRLVVIFSDTGNEDITA